MPHPGIHQDQPYALQPSPTHAFTQGSRFHMFPGNPGSLLRNYVTSFPLECFVVFVLSKSFPSSHPLKPLGSNPLSSDEGYWLIQGQFIPLNAGFHTHCQSNPPQSSGQLPAGVMSPVLWPV